MLTAFSPMNALKEPIALAPTVRPKLLRSGVLAIETPLVILDSRLVTSLLMGRTSLDAFCEARCRLLALAIFTVGDGCLLVPVLVL